MPVIIRAVTADGGPFYSGITHSQDFTRLFKNALEFPVLDPKNGLQILNAFKAAANSKRPVMIIERKSLY